MIGAKMIGAKMIGAKMTGLRTLRTLAGQFNGQ